MRRGAIALFVISSLACRPPRGTGVPRASDADQLPFTLDDNLVRVLVTLNGVRANAVIDSGTGALLLDRSFAVKASISLGEAIGNAPGGGETKMPIYPITVSELDIGPVQLVKTDGVAVDLSNVIASAGFSIDVLLGRTLFEQRAVRIDYAKRMIRFLPPNAIAPCTHPIAMTFAGGVPVIEATLRVTPTSAPRILRFVVDLGARHQEAYLGGAFLGTAEGKALERSGQPAHVGTGVGGDVVGVLADVASLEIGSQTFAPFRVALTRSVGALSEGIVDGILGVPLWDTGVITFDYPHLLLCLDVPRR